MARSRLLITALACLSLWGMGAFPVNGQLDTTAADPVFSPLDPQTALRRAFVPGWGQLYNRQYYKVPIVYLGIAAFVGSAILVNRRYLLYRHAYLYTARTNRDGSPIFPEYESDYSKLLSDLGLVSEQNMQPKQIGARRARLEPQILAQRNALRRNRDLLYVGTVAWYGFTIIDAFVSAHLSEFDVNESLTVRMSGGVEQLGLTLTW